MKNIGLFYGSDTGNTKRMAKAIAKKIGEQNIEVIDLHKLEKEEMEKFSHLIFGAPTWYDGELQSDWEVFFNKVDDIDFSDKTVAMFGLGDQSGYPEYFLDALGIINKKLIKKGATIVGQWPCDDYDYEYSKTEVDGKFVGLGLDEDNESDKSEERIKQWLELIKPEFGI